jgi:hypothetical protein
VGSVPAAGPSEFQSEARSGGAGYGDLNANAYKLRKLNGERVPQEAGLGTRYRLETLSFAHPVRLNQKFGKCKSVAILKILMVV